MDTKSEFSIGGISNRRVSRSLTATLLIIVLVVASLYVLRPAKATSTYTDSAFAGWGATRLKDTDPNSTAPNSVVFPGQKASNFEQIALREAALGYNVIRGSFSPYCTAKFSLTPPDPSNYHFIGDYSATQLARAIKIASYLSFWIVVDYHGYSDLYNSTTVSCWQSAWFGSTAGNSTNGIFGAEGIVGQFKNNYTRIIWEPLNEPKRPGSISDSVWNATLSSDYQAWLNYDRKAGDTHQVVLQNICSYGCGLDRTVWWQGYPTVNDTQNAVLESIHNYIYYPGYSDALIYDADGDGGTYNPNTDQLISGTASSGATLRTDTNLKFVNTTTFPTESWNANKAMVYDANSNGKFDGTDVPMVFIPISNALLKTDSKIMFVDKLNHPASWTTNYTNATADAIARDDYLSMLNETVHQGWPVLNTEGGPWCGACSNSTYEVIGGSAGYSITGMRYIQDVTNYMEANNPRMSWMWWPAASWTDTPGAGLYGAVTPNINSNGVHAGWGTLLSHMHFSVIAHIATTSQTASELTVPESEQRTFQNPRGLQGYYVFYRDSINSVQACSYATSPDGSGWNSSQSTGLSNLYDTCSAIYAQDPSHSRLLVYFVASRHSTSVGTGHNIYFRIGSIADTSTYLTWLTSLQTLKSTNSSENLAYPVIAQDSNGYLHVAFSYTNNAATSASAAENVEVCSSQTANPASNPTWTCSNPRSNNPFTEETVPNITTPVTMPHILAISSGVLVIKGVCSGAESTYVTCSLGSDLVERSAVMTWNGSTQTWGNTASFTFSTTTAKAHVRTSGVNGTATGSYRVHFAYEDGGNLTTRYTDSPYTSWSTATVACICGTVFGAHLTHVSGSLTTERFILFYSTNFLTLYSVNATETVNEHWGPAQVEIVNGIDSDRDGDCDTNCIDANYPTSANSVTELSRNTVYVPLAWVQAFTQRQIWFDKRPLN